MKKSFALLVLLAAALLILSITPGAAFHGESNLDGVYEFQRFESPQGSDTSQKGMMIVKSGYLCHLRVDKEREKMSQEDSDEEGARKAAAAFRSANGTCGKFHAEGDKISITWSATLDPNDDGNTSEFVFVEEDGGHLVISPASGPQFRFVYKRVQ